MGVGACVVAHTGGIYPIAFYSEGISLHRLILFRTNPYHSTCRRFYPKMPPPIFVGAAIDAPSIFIGAAACRHWRRPRAGSFPFPREKGSGKGSQETWEGCTGKPDFSQKSGFKSGYLTFAARSPPPSQH